MVSRGVNRRLGSSCDGPQWKAPPPAPSCPSRLFSAGPLLLVKTRLLIRPVIYYLLSFFHTLKRRRHLFYCSFSFCVSVSPGWCPIAYLLGSVSLVGFCSAFSADFLSFVPCAKLGLVETLTACPKNHVASSFLSAALTQPGSQGERLATKKLLRTYLFSFYRNKVLVDVSISVVTSGRTKNVLERVFDTSTQQEKK